MKKICNYFFRSAYLKTHHKNNIHYFYVPRKEETGLLSLTGCMVKDIDKDCYPTTNARYTQRLLQLIFTFFTCKISERAYNLLKFC